METNEPYLPFNWTARLVALAAVVVSLAIVFYAGSRKDDEESGVNCLFNWLLPHSWQQIGSARLSSDGQLSAISDNVEVGQATVSSTRVPFTIRLKWIEDRPGVAMSNAGTQLVGYTFSDREARVCSGQLDPGEVVSVLKKQLDSSTVFSFYEVRG